MDGKKGGTNPHHNILQNLKNLTQNLKHFCPPPPEEKKMCSEAETANFSTTNK